MSGKRRSPDLGLKDARVDKRVPDARISADQLRLPYTADPAGDTKWTLELNKYQRDNLLELLRRTEHFSNTGDWYHELRNVLELGPKETRPNPLVVP